MEALEELMGGRKDHAHIIKGKRTKRQRLQSPLPFSIATLNSSSGDGENTYSSAEFAESATTEEEEEDMVASCLILLAQGQSIDRKPSKPRDPRDQGTATGFRFTSKRFLEAPSSTGGGKVGIYVYQCKTCDRSFPSFQALGGHRASHKRPKPATVEVKKKPILSFMDDEEDEEEEEGEIKEQFSSSLSLQLITRPNWCPPKVHECSFCGVEFASGQALGGHMRRHRMSGRTNMALSLSPLSPIGFEYEDREAKKQRNMLSLSPLSPIGDEFENQKAKRLGIVLSLDLDLNLPAPVDVESKYGFVSEEEEQHPQQQQQSPLVLATCPT